MFLELLYTLGKVSINVGGDGGMVHEIREWFRFKNEVA
jgi:hypothetical protein